MQKARAAECGRLRKWNGEPTMSVFNCGRGPLDPLYCETCLSVSWRVSWCDHEVRGLKVGDRIKAFGMQVDDGTMGTVDFVESGSYGVTWDEEG